MDVLMSSVRICNDTTDRRHRSIIKALTTNREWHLWGPIASPFNRLLPPQRARGSPTASYCTEITRRPKSFDYENRASAMDTMTTR